MAPDSFSDQAYARVMINHANATTDKLSAENDALKRKVEELKGFEADNRELEATNNWNQILEALVDDLQAGMRELLSHKQSVADENDALKCKVKELEGLCIESEREKLNIEARILSQMVDARAAQEKKLLSQIHSSKESSSQEHKQSGYQDTTAASDKEVEHGAGDDDASSSSSVLEGGMVDHPIEVEESEDAFATHEQGLADWFGENSTTGSNTVPGPTDSFAGVLGRGRMGGDYLE
jgi:hypothetical protein